jgi:hypothetical protein
MGIYVEELSTSLQPNCTWVVRQRYSEKAGTEETRSKGDSGLKDRLSEMYIVQYFRHRSSHGKWRGRSAESLNIVSRCSRP